MTSETFDVTVGWGVRVCAERNRHHHGRQSGGPGSAVATVLPAAVPVPATGNFVHQTTLTARRELYPM
jgi:hypothetical protein